MKTTTERLSENIAKAIRAAKRDGTVAMSLANLKQVTPTLGLNCTPSEYHQLFPEVADAVAKRLNFTIIAW